ncbi:MAG: extracellular solute-binding protein [Atribacterota bacterium]|nr:extracellular solute-binding protein [Atribacterota bacterium]
MKLSKRTVSVTFLVLTLIIGIVFTSNAADEQVVLKFLNRWPEPHNLPYFQDVVKRFESLHPNIKIDMESVANEPIKDKLRIVVGGGTTPDLFYSWGGEFAKKFVRAGVALDLTPYFEKYPDWKASFAPASFENSTFEGKNYGVPMELMIKFFAYNTEIFGKYNLNPPNTWDEFMEICETLKNEGVIPIVFGNEEPWAAIHFITTLNQKMVPDEVRKKDYEPSTGKFSHPGYVKALEYLKLLNDKGYFNEGVNTTSATMANQLFYLERGAINHLTMPYYAKQLDEHLPDKWGAFPMPAITEGEGNQNVITGAPNIICVSAKTKYPDEAVEFLRFLTNLENAEKFVKELSFASSVIEANNENTTSKQVLEMLDFVAEADGMAEWLDTAAEARITDRYLANVQLVIDGTKTPEEAMEEVQEMAKLVREEFSD